MIAKDLGSSLSSIISVGNVYFTTGSSNLISSTVSPLPTQNGYVIIESLLGTFDCVKIGNPNYYGIGYNLPNTLDEYYLDGTFSKTLNTIDIGYGYFSIPFSINSGYVENSGFIMPFGSVYATSQLSGTIRLQNNRWQLISIPEIGKKVKDGFVDKLEQLTGHPASDIIESCSTYYGDKDLFDMYIPGVTNENATGNFPLIYNDQGTSEITAFWVKTKNYYTFYPQDILFNWNS